jgi:DMSO/TMAO reductase YedYZ heme-binding membrane subunit
MTDSNAAPKIYFPVVVAALLSCVTVVTYNLFHFGLSADAFVWSVRVIVKQGFIFYALSYIAAPWNRLRPGPFSAFLLRHRATTGTAFAVTHLSAGACVAYIWTHYFHLVEAISSPVERVLGLTIFAWIFAMLITSNQVAIRTLGRKAWGGLHRYGMRVIWIAYFLDYADRTVRWSFLYGAFLLVLLTILVLRVIVIRQGMAQPLDEPPVLTQHSR